MQVVPTMLGDHLGVVKCLRSNNKVGPCSSLFVLLSPATPGFYAHNRVGYVRCGTCTLLHIYGRQKVVLNTTEELRQHDVPATYAT